MSQTILMWQIEIGVAILLLALVWGAIKFAKVWRAPESISLIFVLGLSLLLLTLAYVAWGWRLPWADTHHAVYFIMLYLWCAAGTAFVACHNTHIAKLSVGLFSQALIIYGLYCLV